MQRSLGRRFVPLAGFIAVQLLIIAMAPSRPPEVRDGLTASVPTDGTSDGSTSSGDGGEGTVGTDGAIDAGGTPGGTDGATGTVDPGGTSGGTDGSVGGSTGGEPSGDTSHCRDGRQFDPAIDFYAPPCTPKFGGSNGGATYQGVTPEKITILRYVGKGNDAVDAILKAQGQFVSLDQYKAYHVAAAKFINSHYELYGRQVEIKAVQGSCETIPPDVACLRNEMKQYVDSIKPYFVFWNTSLCSACFDQLSKLRTPNAGGWHFRDSFNQARAPFHWDVKMSGTKMAQHTGRFWCSQLAGRPAKYAGSGNSSQDLRDNPRKIGVISTDDPENKGTVEGELAAELAKCGTSIGDRKYFYEQNITTADQQRRAAVLRMNPVGSGENAATSVLCFCDLVAPSFLYSEEQQQNYYPENIVVGSGLMDLDKSSQAYMGALGCPLAGSKPCNFEDAFGLSSINAQEPMYKDVGQRIWNAGGGAGRAPFESVTEEWDYLNMIASLIQGAGPNLNPTSMEAGAFAQGFRGDGAHVSRGFSRGNYAWNQDMRTVYWSPSKVSPYNGEPGTYIQVGSNRTAVDGWRPGELILPNKPR